MGTGVKMQTFSIKTFGCKVNQYESQAIRERFLQSGYGEVSNGDIPEVCVVNTCCVTERAEKKGKQYISHIRRGYPDSLLVVTGCSVDYNHKSFQNVNFIVPNIKKFSIIDILGGETSKDGECLGISQFKGRTRAFVKIQDGCNQFCSYCVLPYVRGRSRTRRLEEVLDEVKKLVLNGYREIVLTGIHLGDYSGLPKLLELLGGMQNLLRIRLSSLEPQDIAGDILETVQVNSKICRHFHIPLQSGSDRILDQMNRRYTYSEYKKIIDNIRNRIPDVTFTTDIMVGFPGEGEKDFLATCRAVEEIGFIKVHIFPYSNRPGTKASGFLNKVPQEEIRERVSILKDIADKIAYRQKNKLIGSLQDVLIEGNGRNITGYTSGYIPIIISSISKAVVSNELVKVNITGMDNQFLIGEVFT